MCMSPGLNRSSVLECFKRGNVIEMRNGIMFNFYLGLPHMYCMNSLFGILVFNVCDVTTHALIQLKYTCMHNIIVYVHKHNNNYTVCWV